MEPTVSDGIEETIKDSEIRNLSLDVLTDEVENIVELSCRINKILENILIERRKVISEMQLASFEEISSTQPMVPQMFGLYIFGRSYFVEKDLDDLFQTVVDQSLKFNTTIKLLNDKLKCAGDICSQNDKQLLHKMIMKSNKNDVTNIRLPFIDLMKAKVDFDAQFLKFNSLINNDESTDYLDNLEKFNQRVKQTWLSIDKDESAGPDNKKLKQNWTRNEKKFPKTKLRRSARIASEEVQFIRSYKRQRTA